MRQSNPFAYFLVLTSVLLCFSTGNAQIEQYNHMQYHYDSPESDAFKQNTSVDLYKGILNVNVPLHTYKGRNTDLPMSLLYTADGVQVEEIASTVGLGWNLTFGGRITRVVNGMPDSTEIVTGGTAQQCGFEYINEPLTRDKYIMEVAGGVMEIFEQEWYKPVCMTNPLVTADLHGNATDVWVITMPDGTKYYFGEDEAYETATTYTGAEGFCPATTRVNITSWLLTKIVYPNETDVYRFEYSDYAMSQEISNSGEGIAGYETPGAGGARIYYKSTESWYKLKQQMPIRVYHNDMPIMHFTYDSREDLWYGTGTHHGNRLDEIRFYSYSPPQEEDIEAPVYKKIKFNYGYFGMQAQSNSTNFTSKRLKLESVTFYGVDPSNTGVAGDEYSFHYKESPDGKYDFPDVTSYAQDYLGLYNGKNSNTELIPSRSEIEREFDLSYALTGILDKITYPQKGYSEFDYEQNKTDGTYETNEIVPLPITTVTEQDLSTIDYLDETCDQMPTTLAELNSNMEMLNVGAIFYDTPDTEDTLVVEVRTEIFHLTEPADVHVNTAGWGIYTVHKINEVCTGSGTNLNCSDGNGTITPTSIINTSCMHPTGMLYYYADNNCSFSADLIEGGLTNYSMGYNSPASTHQGLDAGDYQVTLWQLYPDSQNSEKAKIRVYKTNSTTVIPEHYFETTDTSSGLTDGFRIKSITNYKGEGQFGSKKEFRYGQSRFASTLLNSYIEPGDFKYVSSQGYPTAPIALIYLDASEFQVNQSEERNGYIKYAFQDNGQYLNKCFMYTYYFGGLNGNPWNFAFEIDGLFNGQVKERKTYDDNGELLVEESNSFGEFSYEYDTYNSGLSHSDFQYRSGTSRTEYFPDGNIRSGTENIYESEYFIPDAKIISFNDDTTKKVDYSTIIYLLNGGIVANPINYYENENIVKTVENIYTEAAGKSYVSEVKETYGGIEKSTKYAYDSNGNRVTKIASTLGTLTPASYECQIYGYNNLLVVAKISGMRYVDLPTGLVGDIISKSDGLVSTSGLPELESALEALREWINDPTQNTQAPYVQMQSFCYNPSFTLASTIDAKGLKTVYEYDLFGRNTAVKTASIDPAIIGYNLLFEKSYNTRIHENDLNDQNWIMEKKYKVATDEPQTGIDKVDTKKTYFDGFGRTVQEIGDGQGTETGKDVSRHIEYDEFGREANVYLPYGTESNGMLYDGGTDHPTREYHDYLELLPYSEKIFDNSPLNRVLKIGSPGSTDEWASSSEHAVQLAYDVNRSDSIRHIVYNSSEGNFTESDQYDDSLLYKKTIIDEDDNITEIFKNTKEQQILERKHNGTETLDTYNVYDDRGNLVLVVPPKATGSLEEQMEGLCYRYKYDQSNRLIAKKIPGRMAWEFIIYDSLDRVIRTGPTYCPFGPSTNNHLGWLYTFYDGLGRVAYTGWAMDDAYAETAVLLQADNNTAGVDTVYKTNSPEEISGIDLNYTLPTTALPSGFILLTVNYYDDYNFPHSAIYFEHDVQGQIVYYNEDTKPIGLPTGSWVRILDAGLSDVGDTTWLLYDRWGRIIQTHKDNYLEGFTEVSNKLNFIGKPDKVVTIHKRDNVADEISTTNIYTYTNQNQLQYNFHRVNLEPYQALSHNLYTELGRLKTKYTGGTEGNPLQKVDYSYNIRGWLTDINKINETDTEIADLFALQINYNKIYDPLAVATPMFNGNISEVLWRGSDDVLKEYSFAYDGVNRMTDAFFTKAASNTITHDFDEQVTYDKNGNIMGMIRNGGTDILDDVIEIDQLTYSYPDNSNLLKGVYDTLPGHSGFIDNGGSTVSDVDYSYDALGNMEQDLNKGITISYNHLNLPVEVKYDTAMISYIYDALGQKVKKSVHDNTSNIKTTDYLDGYHYYMEDLKFIPTDEGYLNVTKTNNGNVYNYVYNYLDHLGNIRMSYGMDESDHLRVLDENEYYPYGLKHASSNQILEWTYDDHTEQVALVTPTGTPTYQNKFNGTEWQNELDLNLYDMDARDYDPAIARWVNIDPVTHFSQSPFVAFDGNPVMYADPSGADAGYDAMWTANLAYLESTLGSSNQWGVSIVDNFGNFGMNGYATGSDSHSGIWWGSQNSPQNDHGIHKNNNSTNAAPASLTEEEIMLLGEILPPVTLIRGDRRNAAILQQHVYINSKYYHAIRDYLSSTGQAYEKGGNRLQEIGFGLTITGIGAPIGIPLAAIGSMFSTGGAVLTIATSFQAEGFSSSQAWISLSSEALSMLGGKQIEKMKGLSKWEKEIHEQILEMHLIIYEMLLENDK
jgi:RHS repeat-associated protein